MNISVASLKRIALIVGFVIMVIFLAWLIYIIFFRAPEPTELPPTQPTTPSGVGLPEAPPEFEIPRVEPGLPGELPSAIARGGLTKTTTITESPVTGATPSGTTVSFYDNITDQFYSLRSDGSFAVLSENTFPGVQTVIWSPDADSAILEFPDGANILYDFDTEKQITLPKHWEDFDFSPEGDAIIFKSIALDPENNFLAVAEPTGNGARIITTLGANGHRVLPDWSPNRQIIASFTEPLGVDRQELFFIGLNEENFKKVIVNGYNFNAIWNPTGTQLLYNVSSSATNDNPSLWIVNADGEVIGSGRRPLTIQTTVDKCVFADTTTIYCAVPQFLPQGTGIMPSLSRAIPDDIYKINVANGTWALLAELDIPLTVTSLTLSSDGSTLYFTDETTGRLRSIRLR